MKQNNCILIGLTGGIATGKSTVSRLLTEKGYAIIDADIIARKVVEIGKPSYNDIVDTFGLKILKEDKTLNRKKLGRLIFESPFLREKLNSIIHPRVYEEIKKEVDKLCQNNWVIFLDIPLLFETIDLLSDYNLVLKEIWMVYTDLETQTKRLMKRDNIDADEAISKISAQIDVEEKRDKATRILLNNGNLEDLERNLDQMLDILKHQWRDF